VYSGGNYTILHDPFAGPLGTRATGINDRGQIVGIYWDSNNIPHGFLYNRGSYTTLTHPSAVTGTFAYGINDGGQVVGRYATGVSNYGFLFNGTTYAPINVPSAKDTVAMGINNASEIVGYYDDSTGTHGGFLYSGSDETLDKRFQPGPIAGAGLPGLILASGGLLGWWRRKRTASVALSAA
jgi:probable HAF family extracellular repeat protein